MKMVMKPQYSMTSENYGCEMNDYTIDGVHLKIRIHILIKRQNQNNINAPLKNGSLCLRTPAPARHVC